MIQRGCLLSSGHQASTTSRCCCLPPPAATGVAQGSRVGQAVAQVSQAVEQEIPAYPSHNTVLQHGATMQQVDSMRLQHNNSAQIQRQLQQQQTQHVRMQVPQQLVQQPHMQPPPPGTPLHHYQQQHHHHHHHQPQGVQAAHHWPAVQQQQQQQQVRPVHAQAHVQHMTQLVLSCDSLLKLQAVLSIHLHQFTPSCIALAMQHLQRLRREELLLQQDSASTNSCDFGPTMQAVQLQLAGQLTDTLLRQLPVVSARCLVTFLAAAAAMKLVVPAPVLEQMAAHLVNKALRVASSQQHSSSSSTPAHQTAPDSLQQQRQHMPAGDSSLPSGVQQQQQRQPPHVTALSAWTLAKLRLRSQPLWSELSSIAGEQLHGMSQSDCVLLAWACAKAGHHQPRLFYGLQQQLMPRVAQLAPDSISCLLWAYAAAGQYHLGLVSALVSAAADKMERFSPRQLATSLWACGRLRHADARMLSALRVQALACMPDMQPQAVANLASSLASLAVADEALTVAVIGRAQQVVEGFSMQGLANTAWAVVKLQQQLKHHNAAAAAAATTPPAGSPDTADINAMGQHLHRGGWRGSSRQQQVHPHRQRNLQQLAHNLLDAICTAAVGRLSSARPQEVCNILWACATLQHKHEPFLSAAAGHLAAVAEDAQQIDLAQALWALEVLRFRRRATQQALLRSALCKLHTFGPQALSNLSWAVASSGMQHPSGLPLAVTQQLQALLPQMTPQGLGTTLWAISKLGRVPQQLVHAASSHIQMQLPMYNAQDLCNVAMVCAKAGYKEPQLLQALAAAASSAAAVTLAAAAAGPASRNDVHLDSPEQHTAASMQPRVLQQVPLGPAQGGAARYPQHKWLTAQGVCNLVWAFAGTGWCDAQLMQQLQELAVLHLAHLQPRNVAALCQGFALLGQPFDQLLLTLPKVLEAPHQHRPNRGASNSQLQTQQSLQYRQHQEQLQALQLRLGQGQAAPHLLQPQVQRLGQLLKTWPADSLALLVHSVAVAGMQHSQAVLALAALRLLNQGGVADGLSTQRHSQLHMAMTYLAMQWGVASSTHLGGNDQSNRHSSSLVAAPVKGQAAARQYGLLHDAVAAELEPSAHTKAAVSCQQRQHEQQQQQQQQPGAHISPGGLQGGLEAVAAAAELRALATGLLTGTLSQACLRSWQQSDAARQLSRVEQEVAAVLRGMGFAPLVQHWLQLAYALPQHAAGPSASSVGVAQHTCRALSVKLGLCASVLGPGRRRPLALSVLPPAALSSSWPRQVLGQTALEHKCLEAAGWQVVCMSWEDWDGLGGDLQQQQAFLRELCGV